MPAEGRPHSRHTARPAESAWDNGMQEPKQHAGGAQHPKRGPPHGASPVKGCRGAAQPRLPPHGSVRGSDVPRRGAPGCASPRGAVPRCVGDSAPPRWKRVLWGRRPEAQRNPSWPISSRHRAGPINPGAGVKRPARMQLGDAAGGHQGEGAVFVTPCSGLRGEAGGCPRVREDVLGDGEGVLGDGALGDGEDVLGDGEDTLEYGALGPGGGALGMGRMP